MKGTYLCKHRPHWACPVTVRGATKLTSVSQGAWGMRLPALVLVYAPPHCFWDVCLAHRNFVLGAPEVYRARSALKDTADKNPPLLRAGLVGGSLTMSVLARPVGKDRCVTPGKMRRGIRRPPLSASL